MTALAALAMASAIASGWIMYSFERVRRHKAETTTDEAQRHLLQATLTLGQHKDLLHVAQREIRKLLDDADACTDPVLVRKHLDGLSKELSENTTSAGNSPLPTFEPGSHAIIEGDLD